MSPKHQPARWYCDQLRQEGYRQVLWEDAPGALQNKRSILRSCWEHRLGVQEKLMAGDKGVPTQKGGQIQTPHGQILSDSKGIRS